MGSSSAGEKNRGQIELLQPDGRNQCGGVPDGLPPREPGSHENLLQAGGAMGCALPDLWLFASMPPSDSGEYLTPIPDRT